MRDPLGNLFRNAVRPINELYEPREVFVVAQVFAKPQHRGQPYRPTVLQQETKLATSVSVAQARVSPVAAGRNPDRFHEQEVKAIGLQLGTPPELSNPLYLCIMPEVVFELATAKKCYPVARSGLSGSRSQRIRGTGCIDQAVGVVAKRGIDR